MPTFIGDIFSLNDVYERQTTEVDVAVVEVNPIGVSTVTEITVQSNLWSNSNTHGWFGGGYYSPGLNYSTVDRIDFSNDSSTASIRGPLSLARSSAGATGNANYGWFGSGVTGTPVISSVDRIDFSNDSSTASTRGPLSFARGGSTATGNSNYGWYGGGSTPAPAFYSTVDRIDFSNDSFTASVKGPLSRERSIFAATGNTNYGWYAGGNIPSPTTTITTVDRIDFSNDSPSASIRGPLSAARQLLSATSNTPVG